MLRSLWSAQFVLFLAVGGTAAAVNWCARWGLSHWIGFGWAVVLAYLVGMAVAFAMNRRWVFPRSTRPVARQARDFTLVNLLSLTLVWLASLGFEAGLRALGMVHGTRELAHGVAVGLPALLSFHLYRLVAFREADPSGVGPGATGPCGQSGGGGAGDRPSERTEP